MKTQLDTYFTNRIGSSQLLYSAEDWVEITLRLQTAGPVAVSTRQEIVPVLSGKGVLLPVDDDLSFILPKGDRLFIAASAVNRVSVTIQPVPWLRQILMALDGGFASVARMLGRAPAPAPRSVAGDGDFPSRFVPRVSTRR